MSALTPAEQGMLLLGCDLGDGLRPLTPAHYRRLSRLVLAAPFGYWAGDVTASTLRAMGCSAPLAEQVVTLLDRRAQLAGFLQQLAEMGLTALTRLSPAYPPRLVEKLGERAPLVLFCAGETGLLHRPAISVVGARKLSADGAQLAREAGAWIASRGYVLCTGGAPGADREATAQCLAQGGSAVWFVPGGLAEARRHMETHGGQIAILTADSPWATGWPERALARNRWIHSHGQAVVVCQCDQCRGGTWRGSEENLRAGWTPVFVADDGREGTRALLTLGAQPLDWETLASFPGVERPIC